MARAQNGYKKGKDQIDRLQFLAILSLDTETIRMKAWAIFQISQIYETSETLISTLKKTHATFCT